jgi:hypothetical protein
MTTSEDRIELVLRPVAGTYFCDGCLALQVGVSLREAQAVLANLGGRGEFEVTQAECSICRRRKVVVAALAV